MIKALDLGHPKIAELKVTYEVTASYFSCEGLKCPLLVFFNGDSSLTLPLSSQ